MLQLQKFFSYMGFTNFIAQNVPVMDPGEGPGRPAPPPIFLDQTEAQRAKNFFFETAPPPPLCQGLDDRAPPLSEGLDPPLCGHFISFETDM